ncbi:DUF2452 domain containing protein [Asbolus verrucosus]|uniref:DUF2452 domain containing protein n=1 Tax=Asbolus verrucosus TaxID=1661398 RepID=A0A482VHG5_ASBVE|nr:DUF2452 domain containing protein [Asbolus verrucosus]
MATKRPVDSINILNDESGPSSKGELSLPTLDNFHQPRPASVVLVEREAKPGGVALVNPVAVAKKSYVDLMTLSEGVSNVNTAVQSNAKNKLEIIGRQMKHLQELMTDVFEETKLSIELHQVACNFVKRPGHLYHLYMRPSGQRYFGMLSPEEWRTPPHEYLGSYVLEPDLSWTPATADHGRHEGIDYLREMLGVNQIQALTAV